MTQQERSQVWARKVELTELLNSLPDSAATKKQRDQIRVRIEQCNTQLIQDQIAPEAEQAASEEQKKP